MLLSAASCTYALSCASGVSVTPNVALPIGVGSTVPSAKSVRTNGGAGGAGGGAGAGAGPSGYLQTVEVEAKQK